MSTPKAPGPVKAFLIETFWPWFLKDIWPMVLAYLLKSLDKVFQTLSDAFGKFIDRRMQSREQQARERAEAADEAARAAVTTEARSEAQAVARVWREVAEQFRQENESLRVEMDAASRRAYEAARTNVEDGKPVLARDEGQLTLGLGGKTSTLPALPELTQTED